MMSKRFIPTRNSPIESRKGRAGEGRQDRRLDAVMAIELKFED